MPRLIGAMMILISGFTFGLIQIRSFRQEELALEELIRAIDTIAAELACRLTALPELCLMAAKNGQTQVSEVFKTLSTRLYDHNSPSAGQCLEDVILEKSGVPELAKRNLMILANSFGQFDMELQLSSLDTVKQMCRRDLAGLQSTRETKLKSTQVLGFCAGAALVILLI